MCPRAASARSRGVVSVLFSAAVLGGLVLAGRLRSAEGATSAADQGPDPWEAWSTRPDGRSPEQDLLLLQGRLRHTVTQNNIEAFKAVLASHGCSPGVAQEVLEERCAPLLHHGDANGRSIYHLLGKLGFGGDYVMHKSLPGEGIKTAQLNVTEPWYMTVEMAIKQKRLDADSWRTASLGVNDVMEDSMLFKVYQHSTSMNIKPKLTLRDASGQTPAHEAALHGHVLTVRAMVILSQPIGSIFEPDAAVEYDGDFLRAMPLRREWAFGWTMMNFAAMSARDSVLRSNVQSAMSTAMESRDNFEVTKGMTIMDYAAIRGHAAVIEYLGWLEKDPASPVAGRVGLAGLGFAPSNWREKPVQKAVTMGHLSAVKAFLEHYSCAEVLSVVSEGGESIFHNAVGGGHSEILQFLKTDCPIEYAAGRSRPVKGGLVKYLWSEQTPCQLSQSVLNYINEQLYGDGDGSSGPEFPENFVGYHRHRCWHDSNIRCVRHDDCTALARDGRAKGYGTVDNQCLDENGFSIPEEEGKCWQATHCDFSTGAHYDVYELLPHFATCRLVCEGTAANNIQVNLNRDCGPELTDALRFWITGQPDDEKDPYGPKDPQRGPPQEWKEYRANPFEWSQQQ